MQELVVISGKGGTGKTSLVASFAALAEKVVLADCDVDAANLHLVINPTIVHRQDFSGGRRARIESDRCIGCGKCAEVCRFSAVSFEPIEGFDSLGPGGSSACRDCSYCRRSCSAKANSEIQAMVLASHRDASLKFAIDPIACEGCGVCAYFCAENAIDFSPVVNGELFVSETRFGPMVHARLGVAEENSGKLVSQVRKEAKKIAQAMDIGLVLIDGSPGIGCPVVASITGAALVLVVTEPTLSGIHDLQRVADLTKHFGVKTSVCINKWDVNRGLTADIEAEARQRGIKVAGRIRYDREVTMAQIHRQATVERESNAAEDIRSLWKQMKEIGAEYGVQL